MYFDGSTTRLDALTTVKITKLNRNVGHGYQIDTFDSAGQTWNRVVRLGTGSSFSVRGPNNSVAEVRGTEFSFAVKRTPSGKAIVHLNTWSGVVNVTAEGHTVAVTKGSQTMIETGRPPSAAAPIPQSDKKEAFTVFNKAADQTEAVTNNSQAVNINVNSLNSGQATDRQEGATADGNSDLTFSLAWPGSSMELIVLDPDGAVYASQASDSPPVTIEVTRARAGKWGYRVHDIKSDRNEAWSVAVAVQTPSLHPAQPAFAAGTNCDHTVTAGARDSWVLTAKSPSGKPTFSADILPAYATFTDNGDGSAAVTFAPPATVGATTDVTFNVTAEAAGGTAELTCVEHVQAAPTSVGGTVAQPDGTGIEGVTVNLSGRSGLSAETTTDGGGSFGFAGLQPGTYDLKVTLADGYVPVGPAVASATVDGRTPIAGLAFVAVPAPAVTSVSPNSGTTAGGTVVTIQGRGFTAATGVRFGSIPAAGFSVDADGEVTATSPAAPAGRVHVTVTTAAGSSPTGEDDSFTFGQLPVVGTISPPGGPSRGGTAVTIDGSGFSGATAVSFGPNLALDFKVTSDARVVATSPPGSGVADVVVSTVIGSSPAVASGQFTYSGPAPSGRAVSSVSPLAGPAAGGTTVTVSGSGFTSLATLLIGSAAADFTLVSDNQLQATTPSGPDGPAQITLNWADGSPAAVVAADSFTFQSPPAASSGPVVKGVNPGTLDAAGGTVVEVNGSGFTGALSVSFGGVKASFNLVADGQLEATAPPGKGTVDVVVTTASGSSPIVAEDQVAYLESVPPITPGPPPSPSPSPSPGPDPSPSPSETPSPSPSVPEPSPGGSPTPAVPDSPSPSPASSETPKPADVSPSPSETPGAVPTPTPTPSDTPTPTATDKPPQPSPDPTPSPATVPDPTPTPPAAPAPTPSPATAPDPTPSAPVGAGPTPSPTPTP